MSAGRVDAVWGERLGAGVATAASEGDQVITVDYAGDFAEDGGRLLHRESGETYSYDTADPDGDTITLTSPLPTGVSWDEGDAIYVHPLASDWFAAVRLDDVDEEPVVARLPFSMRSTLPEGIREFGRGEPVTLDDAEDEWVVVDVSGTELDHFELRDEKSDTRVVSGLQPDGTFATVYSGGDPLDPPTDPQVTARQLALAVYWDGQLTGDGIKANFQRTDVHVSETSGFTAGGQTLYGSLFGEGAITVPADVVPHHVKLVAVTNDDAASGASGEVSATPNPAGELAAESVKANHLAAVLTLTSRLVAGDPSAARVEINGSAIEAFDADGNRTVAINSDGSAFFDGELGADTVGAPQLTVGAVEADKLSLGSGDTGELLTDPSFESGIEGTEISGTWNRSTTGVARSGDTSLFTSIGGGVTAEYAFLNSVDVTGSSNFDTSAWIKTFNETFTVEIRHVYSDSGGAVVQDTSNSQNIANDGNWHKIDFNTSVPDTAATLRPSVRTTNNGTTESTTYVDDASVMGNATNVEFTNDGMEIRSTANLADGDPAPFKIHDETFRTMRFDSNQIEAVDTDGVGQTLFLNPVGAVVLGTTNPSMRRMNGMEGDFEVQDTDSNGQLTIPHHLEATPVMVQLTVRAADGNTYAQNVPAQTDANNIVVQCRNVIDGNPLGGGNTTGVYWFAMT